MLRKGNPSQSHLETLCPIQNSFSSPYKAFNISISPLSVHQLVCHQQQWCCCNRWRTTIVVIGDFSIINFGMMCSFFSDLPHSCLLRQGGNDNNREQGTELFSVPKVMPWYEFSCAAQKAKRFLTEAGGCLHSTAEITWCSSSLGAWRTVWADMSFSL